MAELVDSRAQDALSELVHQFSDRFAFTRELVQNAIDAGSSHVVVTCEYEGPDDAGVATVTVTDDGCGMTRSIIENQLTRLFASSKTGDRTKIGKFGIGFVSVFSLDPDAVCVDTGREGERWRVVFGADRTYELRSLAEPIEGTRVRVVKRLDRKAFEEVREAVRTALRRWCRHVPIDLSLDGTVLSEPFALDDAPCQLQRRVGDTTIVVGHHLDGRTEFGFFSKGLTLREGYGTYFEGVSFKVDSPGLEHTLTRDAVIENTSFVRALAAVRTTILGELAELAITQLGEALARDDHGAMADYLARAVAWHCAQGLERRTARRALFVTPTGQRLSLRAMSKRHRGRQILTTAERSPLSDALEADGRTVVVARCPGVIALVRAVARNNIAIGPTEDHWCVALEPRQPTCDARALLKATTALLRRCGSRTSGTVLGQLHGHPTDGRVAMAVSELGEAIPRSAATLLGTSWLHRRRAVVIDASHSLVVELATLASREPELAAHLLVKSFWLGTRLDVALDARLSEATLWLMEERRG